MSIDLDEYILQCRGGFESEACAEFAQRIQELGYAGYPEFIQDQGWVKFRVYRQAGELFDHLDFSACIFIRQWFKIVKEFERLPARNRLEVILPELAQLPQSAEALAEVPDTTEGRELSNFCQQLTSALTQCLRKTKQMLSRRELAPWQLHLFALSGTHVFLGISPVKNASSLPMGILRLKFPKEAPSRSTLKLEEAWHQFIPKEKWALQLGGGKTAVDLGAAPGGWTWQLVDQNMFVTAIDNGPMHADLMESGQVIHRREDAFRYAPEKPVDWMVCDVADKPLRVTAKMLEWAENQWCHKMIFNLKLPMKQRYKMVNECMEMIHQRLSIKQMPYVLQAKHLYHDREEITCFLDLCP